MPEFRAAVERVLAKMRSAGLAPLVYETTRTDARQLFLYGFGRDYDDGRGIVTRSRTAEDTYHGYGLAVDIVCAKKMWDAPGYFWETLGKFAREEGLLWGDDWDNDGIPVERDSNEHLSDKPHVQYPHLRSPSETAKQLRAAGKLSEVWAMARRAA